MTAESKTMTAHERAVLYAEIGELFARYCQSLDDGDGERWSACFEPEVGGFHRASGEPRIVQGHEALAAFCDARPAGGLHVTVNSLIVGIDEEEVQVRSGLVYLQSPAEGERAQVMALGTYEDTLVRVDGKLLFRARKVFLNR